MPTNDLFANAIGVGIAVNGGTYTSAAVANSTFGTESGEDTTTFGASGYYHSAWWKYTPNISGTAVIDTILSGSLDTTLVVYTGNAVNALTRIAYDDDSGGSGTSQITMSVTAGTTYRIRVAARASGTTGNYVLRVVGPATGGPIAAVPIDTWVEPQKAAGFNNLFAPAINTEDSQRAAEILRIRRALVDPVDASIVPVARPVFTVAVAVVEGILDKVTVELQYATDPAFATAVTLSQDFILMQGANTALLQPNADLAAGTYFWRIRLIIGGSAMDYTAYWHFTVDTTAGAATIGLTWTVQIGATTPHLWSLRPDHGQTGQPVTLRGQGFPANPGTVKLGTTDMPVQSWSHIPATANAAGANRVIADTVDPEHDEIVVLVPDSLPPGGAISLTGDNGA